MSGLILSNITVMNSGHCIIDLEWVSSCHDESLSAGDIDKPGVRAGYSPPAGRHNSLALRRHRRTTGKALLKMNPPLRRATLSARTALFPPPAPYRAQQTDVTEVCARRFTNGNAGCKLTAVEDLVIGI
jgi:hypothetical protein